MSLSKNPSQHELVSKVRDIETNKANKTDNISQFTQDSAHRTVTDTEKVNWNNKLSSYTETDPTVPSWAKQPTKPTYDYSEIKNTPTIPTGATLYDTTGQNTDGAMTQKATTDALSKVTPTIDSFLSTTSKNPVQNKTIKGALDLKVDKVSGKGLSTNDLDDDLKLCYDAAFDLRHTHSNKELLDTYTQTETNLADAVSKKHSHPNMTILANTTASYTTAEQTKLSGIETGAQKNTVTSVADLTGDVSATNLISKLLTGGVNYGDKIVAKSIASNGYIQYSSGLIIQWGSATSGKSYTFLKPFKGQGTYGVSAISTDSAWETLWIGSYSNSAITITSRYSGKIIRIIAIGY